MNQLKEQFFLDPDVIFLNHGSFGATPRPVLEAQQVWQRRLEQQPVQFLVDEMPKRLAESRAALAGLVQAHPDDLVFVPNATFGVNVVARSLKLEAGDEVLATDHEYGACDFTWQFLSRERGFLYRKQPVRLPANSSTEIVEQFWQGVNPKTKVIFMSHITSTTAVRLPVEAICRRAQAAGILTVIDGAHAVGQIPLDLAGIGADFYVSNAHKWLCSPKGSAFLFARRERQALIEPLVVSWSWGSETEFDYGSQFLNYLQWMGTDDPSAYLAVPAAIQFQASHDWTAVRRRCHDLGRETLGQISDLTGLAPAYPATTEFFQQMFVAPLPPVDGAALKQRLLGDFGIEVPITCWRERQFIRVSVQGYNGRNDLDALVTALAELLPQVSR